MSQQTIGVLYGLSAFVAWGFLPAYWKQLQAIDPFEILCHRIVWSCLFLCLIISAQRRWSDVRIMVGDRRNLLKLTLSGLLVSCNWFVYILAVNNDHVVETSLGYYITPMVNVCLGFLLLGERFRRLQMVAVACAAAGVAYALLAYGNLPVYGLFLAFSFAFYGYARKKIPVKPIPGLLMETTVLLLPALGFILYRQFSPETLFLRNPGLSLWLVGAGIATSLPLLCFSSAARHLRLSTVGVLQYLAPSIAFGLGVFVYLEPFDYHNLITFALIWIGVALYCADALLTARKTQGSRL
ncbi:MAG: EamA family transporter RarD [Deltaproteobacteria bacterium]|nr:EamA family transporter RarD [Deltaproteobacteria bacterium]NCP02656.1 EamA family transporter RarD [Deltaproteobacteria bacterium]